MTSPAPHWKIFGRIVCAVLWLGVSSVAWSVRGAEVAGGPASLASAPDLTPLWELDPLRVHCAVCVETAANWNDLRRQALADGILAGVADVGQRGDSGGMRDHRAGCVRPNACGLGSDGRKRTRAR